MKKTIIIACFLVMRIFSNAQTTDSITGPRLWLSADRSLITPTKWTDLSFFKNDAVGASPLSTPSSFTSINFNKALVFDGVDDYLKVPVNLENSAEITVLSVFQSADTTERGIWGTEESTSRVVLLTTRRAIGPDTVADAYGASEKVTVLNSVLQNWDKSTVAVSDSYMALGSAGYSREFKPYQGAIAELIVFKRALSFLERVQYETYLAIKYGTGINSGNLVSSQEKVLWHSEHNKEYTRNIAGLGRDDHFHLYQKQSGSAYDSGLLIMNVGKLAASNEQNTAVIADQNFLVWGDNGLSLTNKPGVGADSLLSFIQRKWLITVNGNGANNLATEIRIDISQFPTSADGYWLIVDRSGSGNFSIDNIEYIFPSKVENNTMVFENVLWDTDGSGKDNFGFAKARSLFAILKTVSNPSCTDSQAGKIKINVIAGASPYNFKLTTSEGTLTKEWKETEMEVQQKDLIEGNYILTMKDASGEMLTRKFTLITPDALHIDLGADRKYSSVNPIVLDVSSQIPDTTEVSYLWENSFGFSSTDEKIQVSETGIYRLQVTKASDGCVFTDEVAITGAEAQRVALYPNLISNSDHYNISVSLQQQGPVAVKIFSSTGLLMDTIEVTGNSEYQLIRQMKESGLFVIVIQTAKGIESRKLIVH